MGKIKKKGTCGQAKNYITRTQAVRKLQISLPDFRRLCIYKGIYPREPRNKKKAFKSSTPLTTFYYTKDVQYLLHEPLLVKFREHKALARKISRALGRGEVGDAARLEKTHTPRITLDHIIKERYPTFIDALRDLDDALSMLFLFANLPSTSTIPPKTIALCQRLCLEFEHYLIVTHSLQKSFLSIKGIYYQATIEGQDIMWLVPYKFVQRVAGDIDFRIMGTFIEFYTTLLGFVNFRLYTTIGLVYPPSFDASSDERGGELGAFTLQGRDLGSTNQQMEKPMVNGIHKELPASDVATAKAQATVDALAVQPFDLEQADAPQPGEDDEQENDDTVIDSFTPVAPDADTLLQPSKSASSLGALFSPFAFYLSRETPRQPLELLIKAFGCKRVGWDAVLGDGAFTHDEFHPSITHQIVDRPNTGANPRVPGRTYVQPQWVWDCVNQGIILRPDVYAPGATLPPHLSPWVKPTKGAYDPTAPLDEVESDREDVNGAQVVDAIGDGKGEADAMDVNGDKDEDESEEKDDATKSDTEAKVPEPAMNGKVEAVRKSVSKEPINDDFAGFSSESDNETRHQRELEAEARGVKPSVVNGSNKKDKKAAAAQKRKQRDAEDVDRRKQMLSQKKRKLYEVMQYGNKKRDDEAERLRDKRRRIEAKRAR